MPIGVALLDLDEIDRRSRTRRKRSISTVCRRCRLACKSVICFDARCCIDSRSASNLCCSWKRKNGMLRRARLTNNRERTDFFSNFVFELPHISFLIFFQSFQELFVHVLLARMEKKNERGVEVRASPRSWLPAIAVFQSFDFFPVFKYVTNKHFQNRLKLFRGFTRFGS